MQKYKKMDPVLQRDDTIQKYKKPRLRRYARNNNTHTNAGFPSSGE